MKRKITTKLGVSIASIAISVILLAAVSFAWYTINTKAEAGDLTITFKGIKWPFEAAYQEVDEKGDLVEDQEGEPKIISWGKEINLSAYLQKLGLDKCQLRPISTYDLQHWYLSLYSVTGDVNGFEETNLDVVANKTANLVGEGENEKDQSTGSVIYFDIWVRETNEGEQAGLKLSTVEPRSTESGFTYGDALVDETVEGTYILTKPSTDSTTGKYALTTADQNKDALNSIRIGFAALDSSNNITDYFIYEPNADSHSSPAHETGSGYSESYDTHYVLNDIQQVDDAAGVNEYDDASTLKNGTTVNRFADYVSLAFPKESKALAGKAPLVSYNEVNSDKVVKYRDIVKLNTQFSNGEKVKIVDASTGADGKEYDLLYTYVPTLVTRNGVQTVELHPQMTVRQLESKWDVEKVSTKIPGDSTNALNSSCVKTFGQFVDEAPVLCTVANGTPQKIRIFIWIEGQDVDCWNEIAGGAIFANLEFTGVEIADVEVAGEDS